jgi:carbamoyltransferase
MPSTVSIYCDGKIVAVTHEERFTRKKNDEVFPRKSIHYCLKEAGINAKDLDAIAIASFVSPFDDIVVRRSQWSVEDYLYEQYQRWKPYLIDGDETLRSLIDIFPDKIDLGMYPSKYWKKNFKLPDRYERFLKDRNNIIADYLGVDNSIVKQIEHHRCHAAYAYYISPFRGENILAFTIDGMGDGLNATIGIYDENGNYKRVYETSECNIGRIYRYMTLVLGMKPNEHEYKVMGLAPYGKEKYAQNALDVFRDTLYVDGIDFKWKVKPTDSYFWFRERLEGFRFDNIAWALQSWVEELLTQWVQNAIHKFGIRKIVISGGVAMNIKAMGRIADLPEVEAMFVGGSGSDESMAISSSICLAEDLSRENGITWNSKDMFPIQNLYLGPSPDPKEIKEILRSLDSDVYEVKEDFTAKEIALMLADGKIIARCTGRMEFGQRALGNRSILADPIDLRIKERINSAIKNRDFWMPFAPVIMDKFANNYLINPKNIECPHMTIGFETTKEGYNAMIAACHPADKSARPQILHKNDNSEVYEILEEFQKVTGRCALLNTSFNLHGYPIVNTPTDAMHVFENSGLDGLLLENTVILKK